MLRPGIDAQGHRKSSRERERSGSSVTEQSGSTDATSVGEPASSAAESVAVDIDEKPREGTGSASAVKAGNVEELTESMSSLKMVPRSITFGKRKGRSGLAKS